MRGDAQKSTLRGDERAEARQRTSRVEERRRYFVCFGIQHEM